MTRYVVKTSNTTTDQRNYTRKLETFDAKRARTRADELAPSVHVKVLSIPDQR
jgi:hypothetical protein